jgi:CubicO group peptidase (beta-lactamase class C family)
VVIFSSLTIVVALTLNLPNTAKGAEPSKTEATMEGRVQALSPDIEAYVVNGMKGFDIPGLAIGIVANDRLVYAKGFGVRSKSNRLPVDLHTIFQIGSTAKAFLAVTEAIMVDRGKLRWDDRVADLYPEFQLKDSLGDTRIPRLRLACDALRTPAIGQRHSHWSVFIVAFTGSLNALNDRSIARVPVGVG